eukprot:TRINITY_DN9543_c0_g1_i1.p1 TRINITY_DN9543_c0_g1~~TRINITY_DN9543_c0_g1_i1.p1  ORF type:complete len:436 (-),score=72.88 TRINITY_DN9543_c0_g1_i1:167-1474(-)
MTSTTKKRIITQKEFETHDKEGDAWMVIHNKVYDVSKFADHHPGGRMIYLGVKRDATVLFESSHISPHVREQILPKMYIGDLEESAQEKYWSWDDPFYNTLKDRVAKYFKDNKITHHDHPYYYAKILPIIFMWLFLAYLACVKGYLLAALPCGYFFMQMGISIMHDGNHGATSRNYYVSMITGMFQDIMSASSLVWQHNHNIGHHANTNYDNDPDAITGYPFIRLSPHKPHLPHHKYQHYYIWFLYCGVTFRWFFADIVELFTKESPPVKINDVVITRRYLALFVMIKVVSVSIILSIIAYNGLARGILTVLMIGAGASLTAALNFAVTHISDIVHFPTDKPQSVDWAKSQVLTSSNYSVGNLFACLSSGGLNYQIEHHLFPTINHPYYADIAPIVEKTCKEFNVPYRKHENFLGALYQHYLHLYHLGNPDEKSQ